MAYDQLVVKGTTSKILTVTLRSSTTGQRLTGILYSSITISYLREGSANVSVTPVSGTLNTYISSGWVETAKAGVYQFCPPNNALVSGANSVKFTFSASNVIDKDVDIVLSNLDVQDSIRLGITSLPNAVSGTAGGLPTVDSSNYIAGIQGDTKQTGDAFPNISTLISRLTSTRATNLDNLDATVSSRSIYNGSDTSGITTLLSRLTSTRAVNLDNLDSTVSSRSIYSGSDTAGTTTLLSRLTATRAGYLDNLNNLIPSIWAAVTDSPGVTTLLSRISSLRASNLDNLDSTISSRSTYNGSDTSGVTTLLSRIGSTLSITSGKVDINDKTGFSLIITPPTANDISTSVWSNVTRTLTGFGFTVSTNANSTELAIKSKTDNLPATPASTSDIPSASMISSAVWLETIRTLSSTGVNQIQSGLALDSTVAKPGNAMTLTTGERTAIRNGLSTTIESTDNKEEILDSIQNLNNFNPAIDTVILKSGLHTGAVIPTVTSLTNSVDILQSAADKVWNSGTRTLTQGFTAQDRIVLESLPTLEELEGLNVTLNQDTLDSIADSISSGLADSIAESLRGTGEFLFNPRVLDENGTPITNATVIVRRGNTFIKKGITNNTGYVVTGSFNGFGLDGASDYIISIQASGFSFLVPQTLNLTSDTTQNYVLTSMTIPESPIVGLVPVIFDAVEFGLPAAEITLSFTLKYNKTLPLKIGAAFETTRSKLVNTDSNGRVIAYVYPDSALPVGARNFLSVPICNIKNILVVPDGGGNIKDMIR